MNRWHNGCNAAIANWSVIIGHLQGSLFTHMDKLQSLHELVITSFISVWWNIPFISKLQRYNHWSLGMKCHEMGKFSQLSALCKANPLVTYGFPSQRVRKCCCAGLFVLFLLFLLSRPNYSANSRVPDDMRPPWRSRAATVMILGLELHVTFMMIHSRSSPV